MKVNSYLKNLAEKAIVRGDEKTKIKTSVETIKKRLKKHFEDSKYKYSVDKIFIFGSYKRGTNISREFDENSDVDIMVVFEPKEESGQNLSDLVAELPKPQTCLNYLKEFAKSPYSRSKIYQKFPTVVLELNHIKFDLVPAFNSTLAFVFYENGKTYKIPKKSLLKWTSTNPNDLNDCLTGNPTLRQLVRVAKIWNAKQDHIYDSYELEKYIVEEYLFNSDDNLAEYFYTFCELLPISYIRLPQYKKNKIEKLKDLAKKAKENDDESYIKDLFE